MLKKIYKIFMVLSVALLPHQSFAEEIITEMYLTTDEGLGEKIGIVTFKDTDEGLNLTYNLSGLKTGAHGFHVHEHPDCSPMHKHDGTHKAMAAGGHYDPEKTGKHLGPDKNGHKGDLPVLIVDKDGKANNSVTFGLNKNLKASEFKNRSLMIHEGGDNYSDEPLPLGGGGARVACGIIK